MNNGDALRILLPLLIVLSTLLFVLLVFLVCVLFLRKRRGIALRDNDGPIDMSREEIIDGEGGFDAIEARWLESESDDVRRAYRRAKDWQVQYPPNSMPTDITLSQFLAIQEKGVSAWSFEPDYEAMPNVLVHSRTELTFLPDPSSYSSVQSNLPLPKLNEVYYWEVKLFDMPPGTAVSIGLATKPYPLFRMPGWNKYSIAYHSSGDKSYNYPFTEASYGAQLKEGDVLGVGYRPRTGTVFFTRNGRKMEDAFVGLSRWNLFPTIGADGPCTLHVNLGQSGFVFIEANVKKWGLAPSVGTLAPPPAYGSERGSILLQSGGGPRRSDQPASPPRRPHRLRRPKTNQRGHGHDQSESDGLLSPPPLHSPSPTTPPPPLTPVEEDEPSTSAAAAGPSFRYLSPTDSPFHRAAMRGPPSLEDLPESSESAASSSSSGPDSATSSTGSAGSDTPTTRSPARANLHIQIQVDPPVPESPHPHNPPTPNLLDIDLRPIPSSNGGTPPATLAPPAGQAPPAYSPLDAFQYAEGVHIDLPAEVIQAALEGRAPPPSANGSLQANGGSSRRRSGRR
ncbi:SPRY-domain-containing protein [Exidia glandulosa HHB12029]|uniref:SPRY-domain-containing protein n=1 Tax=Exidia glandulosa HHB12029 TaxID=1314781 RepID=A0A165PRJ9_EXIGL|nr:SPRY-domain-containing protein [Exidia glandulosa HHB12029]